MIVQNSFVDLTSMRFHRNMNPCLLVTVYNFYKVVILLQICVLWTNVVKTKLCLYKNYEFGKYFPIYTFIIITLNM